MLDGIKVNQWVLITPEFKSKDLITYCHRKKKETLKENISFINPDEFQVKIETANSFPSGKLYAQNVYCKAIDIPLIEVSAEDKAIWHDGNSEFSENIVRKSKALVGKKSKKFQDTVVIKYIQIEKFLDQLREDHPDLHELVEDSARAQLQNMQDESLLADILDKKFVENIVASNKSAFLKHSKLMSDKNLQSLSFGYLSKWLAECFMGFKKDE